MTTTEKIANAKKRIDELERLIKYWNDSDHDEEKIVYAQKRLSELQILIKYWNDLEKRHTKIVNFSTKIENKAA